MSTTDTTPSPVVQPPVDPRTPKHSRKFRILRATGISVGAIVAAGIIAGSLGGHKTAATAAAPKATAISAPATVTHRAVPAPTVTVTAAPAPAVTVTARPAAPAAPAAPPADTQIANFRGSDTGSTGSFTVPASGNFHLSYAFQGDPSFGGVPVNFQIYEYTTGGTLENVLVNALAPGSGPTAVPVYADPAAGSTVYFKVISEATWNVVVLTGTS